uniref:Enoyl reductase (ER) domain-containing protein n=1 Tax=Physcomitrium patens TaxID=3218 RepID=A0A7I4D4N5_PHYPA
MAKMMHAHQYSKYHGGPSALEYVEVPVPTPKKGDMLVKVEASSVNIVDWRIQDGLLKYVLPRKFPHIPGTDISGEVVSVGSGVEGFAPGDKILSWIDLLRGGGFAEYALAPVTSTVKRPPSISAVDAASLPVAAMTALQSAVHLIGLKLDGSGPKLNILITAASGGVGIFWTQARSSFSSTPDLSRTVRQGVFEEYRIAKLCGCFVTATCGARNMELVRSLGADEVLDYKTPEGASFKSPSGKKYDVVVQLAPYRPLEAFKAQLTKRGTVVDMTPTLRTVLRNWYNKITFSKQSFLPFVLDAKNTTDLQSVTDLVEQGKLKVIVDSTFPLAKAPDAWARSIEGHSTGKVVLIV